MKSLLVSLLLLGNAVTGLHACAKKRIPRYDRPVYSFDTDQMLFRYKFDQIILDLTDPEDLAYVKGAIVFHPEDFEEFTRIYIGGCKEWDSSMELIEAGDQIKKSTESVN